MSWVYLVCAIVIEVAATLSLKVASGGRPRWYAFVIAGYVAAFAFFSLALDRDLPLGVGYGVWSATGVALTAAASRFLFAEPLTRTMVAGIGLIVVGVLAIELSAAH
jgi:small multidrug resistance pump